jgi:nitroreductase
MKLLIMKRTITALLLVLIAYTTNAQQMEAATKTNIKLLEPKFADSLNLYDALMNRGSKRSFSKENINAQDLSNMLWAAAGINRNGRGRTVPLLGDIAIYVAIESGVYLYHPKKHELEHVLTEDIRKKISSQNPVKKAPIVFIYTIDDKSFAGYMKEAMIEAHGMDFYYGNQVAYPTQNIYLYAATNNMNAVVIGGFHREKVDEMLDLDEDHNSYLIQLVGYKRN